MRVQKFQVPSAPTSTMKIKRMAVILLDEKLETGKLILG